MTGVWSLFSAIGEAHAYIASGQKGFELSPQVHRPHILSPFKVTDCVMELEGGKLWKILCDVFISLNYSESQGRDTGHLQGKSQIGEDLGSWCGCTCLLVCSWAGSMVSS